MQEAGALTSGKHIYAVVYPELFAQFFDTGKDGKYLACCLHLILWREAIITAAALCFFIVLPKISQEQLSPAYRCFTEIYDVFKMVKLVS
jgi:hypothetical protein